MCGRYVLYSSPDKIHRHYGGFVPEDYRPSYNITPSQQSLCRTPNTDGSVSRVEWGLSAPWDESKNLINAREETVGEKRTFTGLFERSRCLIPTNGFYEWRPEAGQKQPYFIYLPGEKLFSFAGLYSNQNDEFLILTTEANETIAPIHSRMPLVVPESRYADWLDADDKRDEVREACRLHARSKAEFGLHPISSDVNSPANNSPSLIKPV